MFRLWSVLRLRTGECRNVYVLVLIYRSGQAGAKRAIGDLRNSQHVGLGVVNLYGSKHRNYTNTCKFRPDFVMQQTTELRMVQNSERFRWRERPPSIHPFSLKDALMCPDHPDVTARASLGTEFPEILKINPLNAELNPICYSLALLAHHFFHVSRIRVKSLTLRLLMSYIYIYIYIYIWSTYSS